MLSEESGLNEENQPIKTVTNNTNDSFIGGSCLPPDQSKFLWYSSSLGLGSFIYDFYKKKYDISFATAAIFLTSINYWRHPTYCWRRKLDITTACSVASYCTFRAIGSQYQYPFNLALFSGLLFYPLGVYYYNKKKYWVSTYFHSAVHISANISNIILCSGEVIPIYKSFELLTSLFMF